MYVCVFVSVCVCLSNLYARWFDKSPSNGRTMQIELLKLKQCGFPKRPMNLNVRGDHAPSSQAARALADLLRKMKKKR